MKTVFVWGLLSTSLLFSTVKAQHIKSATPDYWLEKVASYQLVSFPKDEIGEYVQKIFKKVEFKLCYFNPETEMYWFRLIDKQEEISFLLCKEYWSDGIEVAYHIHNSELYVRLLEHDKPTWHVVTSPAAKKNIEKILHANHIDLHQVDIWAFGEETISDSLGYSESHPEKMNLAYGVYDGKNLWVFDFEGNEINYERDNDFHWSY